MSTDTKKISLPFVKVTEDAPLNNDLYKIKEPKFNIYTYLKNIPNSDLFIYLVMIQMGVFLSSRITYNVNNIIGIVIGVFVCIILNERRIVKSISDMEGIEIKMNSISPVPKYFYMDANIINLMFSLMEYNLYNELDFTDAVKSIDNILKISLDVEKGLYDCAMDLNVVKGQRDKALNSLSHIIVSIPPNPQLKNKLVEGIKLLQVYLDRHIQTINSRCMGAGAMKYTDSPVMYSDSNDLMYGSNSFDKYQTF